MNIEEYIKSEAPKYDQGDIHDIAYARELRRCYGWYKDLPLERLKDIQISVRQNHDSSHYTVAAAMILYELIKEKT